MFGTETERFIENVKKQLDMSMGQEDILRVIDILEKRIEEKNERLREMGKRINAGERIREAAWHLILNRAEEEKLPELIEHLHYAIKG